MNNSILVTFRKHFYYTNAPSFQDVTKVDIDAAVALVNRQDSHDIFKTYGPNNDSMLMTLCCKKDDTTTIRAQVRKPVS